MVKRFAITGLLIAGLVLFLSHQHPLSSPDPSDGSFAYKCSACVHGKIAITETSVGLALDASSASIEASPTARFQKNLESLPFGSRAPPLS